MANIIIIGFYEERNLGDDLMAVIFFDLLEKIKSIKSEDNHKIYVYSSNPEFALYGVKTCSDPELIQFDIVLFGGGAFLKSMSNISIAKRLERLYIYIKKRKPRVLFASIGSDGNPWPSNIDTCRVRILKNSKPTDSFLMRTFFDVNNATTYLGIQPEYRQDILFATAAFLRAKFPEIPALDENDINLFSITKKNMLTLLFLLLQGQLWRELRFGAIFFAHRKFLQNRKIIRTGGELSLPLLPRYDAPSVYESCLYLASSKLIITSKLHPGIVALSYGNEAWFINPSLKIRNCILESDKSGDVLVTFLSRHLLKVKPKRCCEADWQNDLLTSYGNWLANKI